MTISSVCVFAVTEEEHGFPQRHFHHECQFKACGCYCHRRWFFRMLRMDKR